MSPAVTGANHSRLGKDEALALKPVHVFLDGVVAHTAGATDGAVARMTLIGLSVLVVYQECENGDLTRIKPQPKGGFGHRKEIAGIISFVVITVIVFQ